MSISGHQGKATAADGRINRGRGADEGSGTRSSLMWETIHIIQQMGDWRNRHQTGDHHSGLRIYCHDTAGQNTGTSGGLWERTLSVSDGA